MSGGIYRGEGVFEIDPSQDSKQESNPSEVVTEPVAAEAVVELNTVAKEVIK